MANILCVGKDDALMQTRRVILERAGHVISQACDLRQVIAACESDSFQIAVLGQSLPAAEKLRITSTVLRYCRGIKVLELHIGIAPDVSTADAHVRVTASEPEALGDAVSALLRKKRHSRETRAA
ncbi:MAG TPA: hypothetical protein VJR04_03575 [Terriglobales bacterium]|nr:hypothetical protein [Terriglobales bacterium]